MKFFNIKLRFISTEVFHFFSKVTEQAIEERQRDSSSNKGNMDFLQLMLNVHNCSETTCHSTKKQDSSANDKQLTHHQVLSQSLLFFVAGFETSAAAITFLCYHLAVDSQVQDKLYQEIKSHLQNKDSLDYESLSNMPYMDQCINEAVRMYPSGFRVDRTCQKDITLKGLHIKKGWSVLFPVYAMHRDPNLWKDPDAFIPERFDDMRKIGNYFMPFGIGPRNCIGRRLAILEVKVAIAHLLYSYKFVKKPDTLYPMKLNPRRFMNALRPILIGLERRT